jgi:hypothetical protein
MCMHPRMNADGLFCLCVLRYSARMMCLEPVEASDGTQGVSMVACTDPWAPLNVRFAHVHALVPFVWFCLGLGWYEPGA